jgi:hypothetical protein
MGMAGAGFVRPGKRYPCTVELGSFTGQDTSGGKRSIEFFDGPHAYLGARPATNSVVVSSTTCRAAKPSGRAGIRDGARQPLGDPAVAADERETQRDDGGAVPPRDHLRAGLVDLFGQPVRSWT